MMDDEPELAGDERPRIYLVDDDRDIRTALSRALGLRGYEVETYGSASEFLAAYDAPPPGCLLLDYGMPEMNGLELQKHLKERGVRLPIIFITGHGGVPESVEAMKMGAVDFLEKPFKQAVLIERIEDALSIADKEQERQDRRSGVLTRFETLTEREREIAELIVRNPSMSSSKEIGRALDISPRTVDHHRSRILDKMAVRSIAELVEVMLSAGLGG